MQVNHGCHLCNDNKRCKLTMDIISVKTLKLKQKNNSKRSLQRFLCNMRQKKKLGQQNVDFLMNHNYYSSLTFLFESSQKQTFTLKYEN